MSDRVKVTLNVEVSALSQYGKGVEQSVRFEGIDGYWKLSEKLRERLEGQWPPAIGYVTKATLQARPKAEQGKYWHYIEELEPKDGPAQTWDWQAELEGGEPQASKPAPSVAGVAAPSGSTVAPLGDFDAIKRQSIQRQTVVNAEAEVLASTGLMAALDNKSDDRDDPSAQAIAGLYKDWREHCDKLGCWEDAPAAEVPTPEPEEKPEPVPPSDEDEFDASIPFSFLPPILVPFLAAGSAACAALLMA